MAPPRITTLDISCRRILNDGVASQTVVWDLNIVFEALMVTSIMLVTLACTIFARPLTAEMMVGSMRGKIRIFVAHKKSTLSKKFVAQRQKPVGRDISKCSGLLNSRILASPTDAAGQKIGARHASDLRRFPVRPPGVSTRVAS